VSKEGGREEGKGKGTHVHQDYVVLVFLDLFDAFSAIVDGEDGELREKRESVQCREGKKKGWKTHLHLPQRLRHNLPNQSIVLRQQHLNLLRLPLPPSPIRRRKQRCRRSIRPALSEGYWAGRDRRGGERSGSFGEGNDDGHAGAEVGAGGS
jgi:hypothetical protein